MTLYPTSQPILIDTSFVIALINARDQYHNQALELAAQYNNHDLIVTDSVLLEIGNALARQYKDEAIQVIEEFITSEEIEVVRLNENIFERSFDLYKTRPDKSWGLVDCISFIVMQDRNIRAALTFDQHFIQAGFERL